MLGRCEVFVVGFDLVSAGVTRAELLEIVKVGASGSGSITTKTSRLIGGAIKILEKIGPQLVRDQRLRTPF